MVEQKKGKKQNMAKKKHKKKTGIKKRQNKIAKKSNLESNIKYQQLTTKTKDILNQLDFTTENMEFTEPPDGVKMSEVILKLADPLLKKYGSDVIQMKTIISLTIIVWNKMMFPEDKQEKLQDKIIDHMTAITGDAEDVGMIVYLNDLITERKKKCFPDLKKLIISYDLSVSGDNISVNITSAPVEPKTKS